MDRNLTPLRIASINSFRASSADNDDFTFEEVSSFLRLAAAIAAAISFRRLKVVDGGAGAIGSMEDIGGGGGISEWEIFLILLSNTNDGARGMSFNVELEFESSKMDGAWGIVEVEDESIGAVGMSFELVSGPSNDGASGIEKEDEGEYEVDKDIEVENRERESMNEAIGLSSCWFKD